MEITMDIFISYSTLDQEHAQEIASKLKEQNISCFLAPKEIHGGEPFKERIREALLTAQEIFVLITPNSLKSEWVITEWGAAWALGKHIVPILLRCAPESLPNRLADLQARDFYQIDQVIHEYKTRQHNKSSAINLPKSATAQSRIILFDIDGTVLDPLDNLQEGIGLQFAQLLHELAEKGYYFVFITGNDFDLQQKRIITPIKEQGLGSSVFCFSDGGTRAFEFNVNTKTFEEIRKYSDKNVMSSEQVETITRVLKSSIENFLEQKDNYSLLTPHIHWRARTLEYLDTIIFPLKPSFLKSASCEQFCRELQELFNHPDIKSASFNLVKTYQGALIIRAYGKNPDSDVSRLEDMIFHKLLLRKEYREISMPEAEIRGGRVACQIAIKPFGDETKRDEFRKLLDQEFKAQGVDEFSVLLGGRTTIDVQIKGVNKQKAVQFLEQDKGLDPQNMIYFGNEFNQYGNDRAILSMRDNERPGLIINVGESLNESDTLRERLLEDHNGPVGTVNYLKFLLHETS
jgi:hydroxymethylpyrimidine pyrophosphatase-like HAD family hydrolase